MFGYIRPVQGELKVRELESFRACYCGLCHALGNKYGLASRFVLNYELVFLSMLLWGEGDPLCTRRGRCIASPLRKRRYCARNAALDTGAGYSVILAWWKLRDSIADEPPIRALPYRALCLVLSGAYRKAAREFGEFDAKVRDEVAALGRYEAGAERSLDGAADKFAQIIRAAAPESLPEKALRPLREMLYHLGRWIYIMDACDDYAGDAKAGRYNPVAALYPPTMGKLAGDSAAQLETTLSHSCNLVGSAFALLPENVWTQTVENMIYLGMPDACSRVFRGEWPPRNRKEKKFGNGRSK